MIPPRSRLRVPTSVPAASGFRRQPIRDPRAVAAAWVGVSDSGARDAITLPGEKRRQKETEANLQTAQSHWMPRLGCLGKIAHRWSIRRSTLEPRPPRLSGAHNVMAHLANWERPESDQICTRRRLMKWFATLQLTASLRGSERLFAAGNRLVTPTLFTTLLTTLLPSFFAEASSS